MQVISEFYTSIVHKEIEGNVACCVLRIDRFFSWFRRVQTFSFHNLSRTPYFLREFQISIRLQTIGRQQANMYHISTLIYTSFNVSHLTCTAFTCARTYCRLVTPNPHPPKKSARMKKSQEITWKMHVKRKFIHARMPGRTPMRTSWEYLSSNYLGFNSTPCFDLLRTWLAAHHHPVFLISG